MMLQRCLGPVGPPWPCVLLWSDELRCAPAHTMLAARLEGLFPNFTKSIE